MEQEESILSFVREEDVLFKTSEPYLLDENGNRIEREIALLKKAEGRDLTAEEKAREEELYRDLKDTERRIGKEIWDIERVEAAK